jgi:hypothetical protein
MLESATMLNHEALRGKTPEEFLVHGDIRLLATALANPETFWFLDIDGILLDSASPVVKDFSNRTGIELSPCEIDSWTWLTQAARENGLPEDIVSSAEQGWFDPEIIGKARPHMFA